MNEILQSIFSITSVALSAGAFSFMIYFKERKVKEMADAVKTKEEAKASKIDNFEHEMGLIPTMQQTITELVQKDVNNTKLLGEFEVRVDALEKKIKLEISKKSHAEKYICELEACKDRKPPFGTFSSDPDKAPKRAKRKTTPKEAIA